MKTLRRMMNRLRGFVRGRRFEQEMSDEIESHIGMQTEENLRAGMPLDEARRAAVLKFGGMDSIKERYRDQRGIPFLESFCADLRFGWRELKKNRAFTVTAVAALALGIGATTAIFSVVNTILLKPLPLFEPDRFVVLGTNSGRTVGIEGEPVASPAKFAHFRKQTAVLENITALMPVVMNYMGSDAVEQWQSIRASADVFRSWGIEVLRGRTFTAEEDSPGGPRVAVISEGLWKRRFAADPQILGKPVTLNGEPHMVIGIVADSPAMRIFGYRQDVYVPFQLDPDTRDNGQYFYVVARLRPGVTLQQARERLQASTADFRAKFPDVLNKGRRFDLDTLRGSFAPDATRALGVLFAAVTLVLLIACANVANLMLARASSRRREIGVRMAIGAGRGRMIRQLLTESLLLSAGGGVLGLLLGYQGIRVLLAMVPTDMPFIGENGTQVVLDWRVVVFAVAVSLATAVLFGLLPAFQASRADLDTFLKSSGTRSAGNLRQNKTRALLVVCEASLAVVLLIGSALFIRTFVFLYSLDRGFDSTNVLTMQTLMSGPKYGNAAALGEAVRGGLERLRSVPGVVSASATDCLPLECTLGLSFEIVDAPAQDSSTTGAGWAPVSQGFFEVFKIPVRRGRTFTDRDKQNALPVAVINETMAKRFWKDRDPLGDRIRIGVGDESGAWNDSPRQIVGVVADVRDRALDAKARPMMYVPQAQLPLGQHQWLRALGPVIWIVRTQTEPLRFASAIQEQLRLATGLPVVEVHPMREMVSLSIAEQQLDVLLMTIFGGSALILACIGIYGLMAYTVEQRNQEMGIRIALGARAGEVRNMLLRQGMRLTFAGVLIGVSGAWGLTKLMESMLFGVRSHDPIVFVTVPVVLSVVGLLSVWIPASRAGRVNPADCLRYE